MDFLTNFMSDGLPPEFYRNLILSVVVVAGIFILRKLVQRLIARRQQEDGKQIYVLGKIANYAVTILGLFLLIGIWIDRSTDVTVILGLVAAGLAFALQEVIGSIAGWLSIILSRPFVLGDRIETGGIHGDVVDISVLRTTLMETGNWLGGMQATGRLVMLSNTFIFKDPLFNYSRELSVVWDEVRVSVPYNHDWEKAKAIIVRIVEQHPVYQELVPAARAEMAELQRKLAVKMSPLEPRAYTKMADSWIEVSVVYPVAYDRRRGFRSDITERILRAFAEAGIPIAFPTMTVDGVSPLSPVQGP